MNRIALSLISMCFAWSCGAQTLEQVLRQAAVPAGTFSAAELAQPVNATSAADGRTVYMAYMRLDANNMFTGSPQMLRFDADSGAVARKELKAAENCCGSPLSIQFTKSFVLTSFHDNPSANTVLVTDKQLRYRATLYGFDFHEIAPDRVVYTENEIHFAAAHPSRLAIADLRSGEVRELYPSQNDALRNAFAAFHAKHMPDKADCAEANDPCDPAVYDEDIDFLGATQVGFQIEVRRTAAHTSVTHGENLDVPTEAALYTYSPGAEGWQYCGQELVPPAMMRFEAAEHAGEGVAAKSCLPSVKVVAIDSGAFTPHPQKGN